MKHSGIAIRLHAIVQVSRYAAD